MVSRPQPVGTDFGAVYSSGVSFNHYGKLMVLADNTAEIDTLMNSTCSEGGAPISIYTLRKPALFGRNSSSIRPLWLRR